MIRNEYANQIYTTPFMCALFEEEGGDLFDVRQAILGHLQQGGDPSPLRPHPGHPLLPPSASSSWCGSLSPPRRMRRSSG